METKPTERGTMLLALILLAIFVVPSSISGTAIALPAISVDTNASLVSLQWVVNAFNLTFACLTLAWGALADKVGHKLCFVTGVIIYSLASFISGITPSATVLDIARALAGVGAAAVFSCGIAILSTNFEGAARLKVFALFGTTAGLGVSLGPTISGLLLDSLGWRAIFYTHTGVLLVVLFGSSAIPRDSRNGSIVFRFDIVGSALFISALLTLMIAIVQSSQWGWGDHRILILLASSIALFSLFWWQEKRHAMPMLDLSLLKNGPFVGYALITVAGSFGFVTLLTYFPTYATSVLNMSATAAGVTMLLLTAPMLVCPIVAGKLAAGRFSEKRILMISLVFLLAGIAGLAVVSTPTMHILYIAFPLLLIGAGYGLAAGLVDGIALSVIPQNKAGMAAGLLNTFRLGSEAIAVSLYGSTLAAILFKRLQQNLADLVDTSTVRDLSNKVASGNFDVLSTTSGNVEAEQMQQLFTVGYDYAFIVVLWLIFFTILLITILIWKLLRTSSTVKHQISS